MFASAELSASANANANATIATGQSKPLHAGPVIPRQFPISYYLALALLQLRLGEALEGLVGCGQDGVPSAGVAHDEDAGRRGAAKTGRTTGKEETKKGISMEITNDGNSP